MSNMELAAKDSGTHGVEEVDGNANDDQRRLLDQLLKDAKLYRRGKEFRELLEFTSRLRHFAPFNAMLLHIQKPGLSYAAYASDWERRFNRTVKEFARPLIILRPFGPVAFVYDVQDTEGEPLPENVSSFFTRGKLDERLLYDAYQNCRALGIAIELVDQGDRRAGNICHFAGSSKQNSYEYSLRVNRNHTTETQFVTLAHELGHLFLGHLGGNKRLKFPGRRISDVSVREFEAESIAYLIACRMGLAPDSQGYLATHLEAKDDLDRFDLYTIFRAAGQVEAIICPIRGYSHAGNRTVAVTSGGSK